MPYRVHVEEKPAIVLTFRSLKDAEETVRRLAEQGQHATILDVGSRCWSEPGVTPPRADKPSRHPKAHDR